MRAAEAAVQRDIHETPRSAVRLRRRPERVRLRQLRSDCVQQRCSGLKGAILRLSPRQEISARMQTVDELRVAKRSETMLPVWWPCSYLSDAVATIVEVATSGGRSRRNYGCRGVGPDILELLQQAIHMGTGRRVLALARILQHAHHVGAQCCQACVQRGDVWDGGRRRRLERRPRPWLEIDVIRLPTWQCLRRIQQLRGN